MTKEIPNLPAGENAQDKNPNKSGSTWKECDEFDWASLNGKSEHNVIANSVNAGVSEDFNGVLLPLENQLNTGDTVLLNVNDHFPVSNAAVNGDTFCLAEAYPEQSVVKFEVINNAYGEYSLRPVDYDDMVKLAQSSLHSPTLYLKERLLDINNKPIDWRSLVVEN